MSREQAPGPIRKEQATKKPKAGPKEEPAAPRRNRELERVEAEIEQTEQRVAELERRLAEDWNDFDLVARHQREREDLQGLIARWEELFESGEATSEVETGA